jgi:type VI secretion system protein VasG
VLLDEVEKAHPDVHEIFFQVFDKGQMEDGSGRLINFRNTLILLTTIVGSAEIEHLCDSDDVRAVFKPAPTPEELEEAIRPAMRKVFPAALLGRIQIVPYYPLSKKALDSIIDLKLAKIQKRVRENYKAELVYSEAVRNEIIRRCDNAASGARLIDAIISNTLLPEISAEFLRNTMEGHILKQADIDVQDGEFKYSFENKDV